MSESEKTNPKNKPQISVGIDFSILLDKLTEQQKRIFIAAMKKELDKVPSREVLEREIVDRRVHMIVRYNVVQPEDFKKEFWEELHKPEGSNPRKLGAVIKRHIPAIQDREEAESIARTESSRISNWVNREQWIAGGTVKTVKWYTAQDENVCEFCSFLARKPLNIKEPFLKKGQTIMGMNGVTMTPDSEVEAPPLHDGCRCYVRPWDISLR
jgi:hypothetical protein